jgi:uncharacterized protein (DUF1697 family)
MHPSSKQRNRLRTKDSYNKHMTKYAALLRGIAPMDPRMQNDKLRAVFEDLGFANVKTVISSGNVLFESPSGNIAALETKIEKAIQARLGFSSTTIIRNRDQLQELVDRKPFKDLEHGPKTYLTVTFLKHPAQTTLKAPYRVENRDYEILGIYDRAICCVLDQTSARTPDLMVWLEKQFGKEITTRTWKTVERILKNLDS